MTPHRRHVLLGLSGLLGGALGLPALGPAAAQTVDQMKVLAPAASALPEMALGSSTAPVTVVEYASMTCGHCAHFHETTFPVLKQKYIDTGKVRFIFREMPLDAAAMGAFMIARCLPADKYFPMVGTLFETQAAWLSGKDIAGNLLTAARQAGMSEADFNKCLSDKALADKIQAGALYANKELGVNATPTFFINGKKVSGALTPEQFDKELEPLLQGK